jgi:alpha-tubulin suppressor-like RCC1 family protein
LGIGHYKNAFMPEKVKGLPSNFRVVEISSGAKHTGIVTEDGKLWVCGSNLHDKLGLEGITTQSKKNFKPVELMSQHYVI